MLETAVLEVGRRLDSVSLLVVNKFGKQEVAGRGFAPVMGEAAARGIPVLVGVNGLNLEPLPPEPTAIVAWAVDAARSTAADSVAT